VLRKPSFQPGRRDGRRRLGCNPGYLIRSREIRLGSYSKTNNKKNQDSGPKKKIQSQNQALAALLGQVGEETLIQVCLYLLAYK
jgi:hypothetical protein